MNLHIKEDPREVCHGEGASAAKLLLLCKATTSVCFVTMQHVESLTAAEYLC
jgi:hypothetical protein